MGRIILATETTPATPSAGNVTVFADTNDDGKVKSVTSSGQVYTLNMSGFDKNLLINGGFDFWQRTTPGTGFTIGGSATVRAYGPDRWAGLASAANVTVQRVDTQAAPETGLNARYYCRLIKTAATGKFAFAQVVEGHPSMAVRGRKVRVQFKMRRAVAAAMTVRLGLIQLNSAGTIDTMPATYISAFGASGTDPTLGASLAYITPDAGTAINGTITGSALSCALSGSWANYSAVFTVPSNCKNLIASVWADATTLAVNDECLIAEAGLFDGPDTLDWVPSPYQWELERCQRFYEKSFSVDTVPAANVLPGRLVINAGNTGALANTSGVRFRVEKRASPTMTFFNPNAAGAQVRDLIVAGDTTATAAANATTTGCDVTYTGNATTAKGNSCAVQFTAESEL